MLITTIHNQVNTSSKRLSFKSLNQEKFDRIFPVFLNNTDEKQKMIESVEPFFSDLQKKSLDKRTLSILDIGCGDGFTAYKFFKMIKKNFPKSTIQVIAIDNNNLQLSTYKNRFAGDKNIFVETENIDVFSKGIPNTFKKADITLVSHSLYHASPQKLDLIIPSIYNSIKNDGVAMISLLKDSSDFSIIQEKFGNIVTSEEETNPVSVKLIDIEKTIKTNKPISEKSEIIPYNAYVYFPKGQKNWETFKKWQIKNHKQKPKTANNQKTLDLLEFILHGDFEKLRQNSQLESFLSTIDKMFIKNSSNETPKINFNGENILLLGKKLINKK